MKARFLLLPPVTSILHILLALWHKFCYKTDHHLGLTFSDKKIPPKKEKFSYSAEPSPFNPTTFEHLKYYKVFFVLLGYYDFIIMTCFASLHLKTNQFI